MTENIVDFKKIGKREKKFLLGLAIAVGLSVCLKLIYSPLSKKIKRYKFQIEKSESRFDKLQSNFPQVNKQNQNMSLLNIEKRDLLKNISEIEKSLPRKGNSPQLLAELIKQAEKLSLFSVKQRLEEGDEYSKLFIELTLGASYQELINYIRRIETISKFLAIEELAISDETKREKDSMPVRIVFSILLGYGQGHRNIVAQKDKDTKVITVNRDIFNSKLKTTAVMDRVDFKLQGITYNALYPTAIINGQVVKTGSEIANFKVKEIQPELVILTDGFTEYTLSIKR